MKISNGPFWGGLAVVLASMSMVSSAGAQSTSQAAEKQNSQAIEEVIVTAQKRKQTLMDVAGTVSVLNADTLRATNTTNLADIGQITTGITVSAPANGQGQVLTVRGVGTNRYVQAISPSVGIFLDDVPLSFLDVAFSNLVDIERIEIIKGPQSTLYGKSVSSGAISLVTTKPTLDTTKGFIDANIGNRGLREYTGALNTPLGDMFAARISGYMTDSNGQIKNVVTDNYQATHNSGGRAHLLFSPNDHFQAVLTYQENNVDIHGGTDEERVAYGSGNILAATSTGTTLYPADKYDGKIATTGGRNTSQRFQLSSLHLDWEISDHWSLHSVTGYQEFTRIQDRADSTNEYPDSANSQFGLFTYINKRDYLEKSQEIRLNYESEKWSTIVGLFYDSSNNHLNTNLLISNSGFPFPLLVDSIGDNKDRAVFFQSSYRPSSDWELVFGLRYSEADRHVKGVNQSFGGFFGSLPAPPLPAQDHSWTSVNGTLKAIYHLSSEISLYASYNTGSKPGGFNGGPDLPTFDEETTQNIEVGVKGLFFDRRLRLDASAYYQRFDDYQENTVAPNKVNNIVKNAAKVVVPGIEISFLWHATDHISVDGSLAYVDAKFDNFKNGQCNDVQISTGNCPAGGTQDLSGKRLNNNSPWTGNLNAQYSASLANTGMNWYVRAEVVYKGSHIDFPSYDPRTRQDGYVLYNARIVLTVPDEVWEVALWGKNLTDKHYVAYYSEGRDGLLGLQAQIGQERAYGVRVRYRF